MKVMGKEVSRKKLVIGIGVILVLIIGISFIKNKSKATMGKSLEKPRQVSIHTVEKVPVSSTISSTGVVEAKEKETLYAQVNATVKDVLETGDVVKAGDVVIRFEPDTRDKLKRELEKLNLQLSTSSKALADLKGKSGKQEILQAESALAQVTKAEKDLKDSIASQELSIVQIKRELETSNELLNNQKVLFETDIISKKEYDDVVNMNKSLQEKLQMAKIQLDGLNQSLEAIASQKNSAAYNLDLANNKVVDKSKQQMIDAKEAEVESIKLQIEGLKEEIEKAQIEVTSPIDGVVADVMVVKNSVAAVGSPMLTILDVSELKVKSDISTFNITQVEIGQEVTIKQDNMEGTQYQGVVSEVAPSAVQKQVGSSSSNVVPVTIDIKDTQTTLKPGFNVEVKVKTIDKPEALTVPILSILENTEEDYKYVFVINDDNKIEERRITELTLDNVFVEVDGLEVGERIVADATEELEEGMIVESIETGDM